MEFDTKVLINRDLLMIYLSMTDSKIPTFSETSTTPDHSNTSLFLFRFSSSHRASYSVSLIYVLELWHTRIGKRDGVVRRPVTKILRSDVDFSVQRPIV